jgi:hypothetical protein
MWRLYLRLEVFQKNSDLLGTDIISGYFPNEADWNSLVRIIPARGPQEMRYCVGFEVLTTVAVKSPIFWDVMPCSSVEVTQRFGGTLLPSSGSKRKLETSMKQAGSRARCMGINTGLYRK